MHRIIIIIVTGGLLVYLGLTTDYHGFINAIKTCNLVEFFSAMVLFSLITWATDAMGLYYQLKTDAPDLQYTDVLRVKGASYLLNIFNYNLALLGMAYYFKKKNNTSFSRNLGSFALITMVDLAVLAVIGLIGTWAWPGVLPPKYMPFIWLGLSIGGLGPLFLKLVAIKGEKLRGIAGKLMGHDLLNAFKNSSVKHLLALMIIRAALIFEYIVTQGIILHSFGFKVPFGYLFLVEPVLTLIGVIPISFSGIGTVQIAMRYIFAKYAAVGLSHVAAISAVDAYSSSSILGMILIRVSIGLINLPYITKIKQALTEQKSQNSQ